MNIKKGAIRDLTKRTGGFLVSTTACNIQCWGRWQWPCPPLPDNTGIGMVRAFFVDEGTLAITCGKINLELPSGSYTVFGSKMTITFPQQSKHSRGYTVAWHNVMAQHEAINGGQIANLVNNHKQWLVGHFFPRECLLSTNTCELKRWRYDKDILYRPALFGGECEFIVVENGSIELELSQYGVQQTELIEAGNYLAIGRGIEKTVRPHNVPTSGLTLRWPSRPHLQTRR